MPKSIIPSKHIAQLLILSILRPCCVARLHEDVLGRICLDLTFELLRQNVDDLLNLLSILHRNRELLLVRKHGVALDEHETLVLLQSLTALFICLERCQSGILSGVASGTRAICSRRGSWLEAPVEHKCESRKLTNRLVWVARTHLVVRSVFTLIIVDEQKLVGLRRIWELERLAAG